MDQVWSTDITYIAMRTGFMYLAAVIDWYSRYVITWRLSNTLDGSFCQEMLEEALSQGRPEVFNTDQGVQFTAAAFTGCTTREDRLNALRAGFQYHVAKPAELSQLAQVVALLSLPVKTPTPVVSQLQQQRH